MIKKYISSTTNSYTKCLNELAQHFPSDIMNLARKAVDPYDKTSFFEKDKNFLKVSDEYVSKFIRPNYSFV